MVGRESNEGLRPCQSRALVSGYAFGMIGADCRKALLGAGVTRGRLLVAVSGGRDSVCLLSLLRELESELRLELVVGHVDHQLRGNASAEDEAFVASLAQRLGIDFRSKRVAPPDLRVGTNSRARPTLEEAARTLRREALLEMAKESDSNWIATGHHAGDQAETVLFRILRGTGPEGLAAMAPSSRDGRWIRPLLDIDPDALEEYAREHELGWIEDASNRDLEFTRNRLRHVEFPRLQRDFNPQLLRTLCNLAETQRVDLEWIDGLVESAARGRIEVEDQVVRLALAGWDELPEALARRLVRRALLLAGLDRDLNRRHIERVLAFLRRGRDAGRDKIVELPCGISLRRVDSAFELGPVPAE
jgi:tRNA(Ile)-lysidine synthase